MARRTIEETRLYNITGGGVFNKNGEMEVLMHRNFELTTCLDKEVIGKMES